MCKIYELHILAILMSNGNVERLERLYLSQT